MKVSSHFGIADKVKVWYRDLTVNAEVIRIEVHVGKEETIVYYDLQLENGKTYLDVVEEELVEYQSEIK